MVDFITSNFDSLVEILIAIIAIFGGSGYWAWKTKQLETKTKDPSLEFKTHLLKQVQDLIKKVDDLQEIKGELLNQVYQLKTDLVAARAEVAALQAILRINNNTNKVKKP
jgi:hypothetical protein